MQASEYGLDSRYDELQSRVRDLLDTIPVAEREPDGNELSPVLVDAFRSGLLPRLVVPKRFGGTDDRVDPVAICLVRELLAAECSQLDSMFVLQAFGSYPLGVAGDPQLQDRWLPKLASGEALTAMALSEPGAGSDLRAATTTITPEGSGLRLDGHKSFISHAPSADVITVFGREGDGFSLVSVPTDTPGVRIERGPDLIAPHEIGDVILEGAVVPASYRLGAPGQAFELSLEALTLTRSSVAGSAVGIAQAALDEALVHCRERRQFGKPLYRHGPVAALLADSAADVEMARLLAYRAAVGARDGRPNSLDYSSMAKLAASEAACRVVDRCVQAMGRFGLVEGSRIARLYLLARPLRIYEGSSEVLRLGVARDLVDTLCISTDVSDARNG